VQDLHWFTQETQLQVGHIGINKPWLIMKLLGMISLVQV
jgi:hypothetical protein